MSFRDNCQLNSGGMSLAIFRKQVDLTTLLNKIENRYLPPYRREEGSLKNSNGELSYPIRTTTPQRVYANTNPDT